MVTPEDIMIHLLPTALEYLNMYLQSNSSPLLPVGQCEQHLAVMWAVAFFLLENFEHEIQNPDWCVHIVQLSISTVSKSATPHGIYLLLLSGLERLIVSGKLVGRVLDQVVKLATDLLTETNPVLGKGRAGWKQRKSKKV